MKSNLRKLVLLSIVLFLAISTVFVSCSKDEQVGPELQLTDEVVVSEDFSGMVGGFIPSPREVYEAVPLAIAPKLKSTPRTKLLTCPPVGNQGRDGACVGWGVGYAARSIISGAQTTFSPNYIYNQIKIGDCASGSYPVDAINLVANQGVATWSVMPYVDGECYTQPNQYQRQNAANYKIRTASRVNIDYNSIRAQIAAGNPVIVGGRVDQAFQSLGYNRILNSVSGQGGGHCYCIVGYYDDYNCFKVMNSWGSNWATNGFGYVSYDIVGSLFSEAYVMGL